jgi:hypothetical protein
MIHFNCPACGTRLTIPDNLAGAGGTCNHCKSKISIPPQEGWGFSVKQATPTLILVVVVGVLITFGVLTLSSRDSDAHGVAQAEPAPAPTLPEVNTFVPVPDLVPPPEFIETPKPAYVLTRYHREAALKALVKAGFPRPKYLELEHGLVGAQVIVEAKLLEKFAYQPEVAARTALLALRNAIYIDPEADPEWSYMLVLNGPNPGPDLELVYGAYFMDGLTGKVSWEDGKEIVKKVPM